MPSVKAFKGLNNTTDPVRLGLEWMETADNVDVTATGAIVTRTGYEKVLDAPISGAYATDDLSRAYVVSDGDLMRVLPDHSTVTLKTGMASGTVRWAEVNQQVHFIAGTSSGIIMPDDEVRDWAWPMPGAATLMEGTGSMPAGFYRVCFTYRFPDGRETGAGNAVALEMEADSALHVSNVPSYAGLETVAWIAARTTTFHRLGVVSGSFVFDGDQDTLGDELQSRFTYSVPTPADEMCFWRGRFYVAQRIPFETTSVIWFSDPLAFHLFDLSASFLMVPGRVLMMAPTDQGLVIGTDKAISLYDGDALVQLAPYGSVEGFPYVVDPDTRKALFWTQRGICESAPFQNLTQNRLSVAPGLDVGVGLLASDGERRIIVSTRPGGSAFNPRSAS